MAKEQPLVTIIILCYNQERYVKEAIQSALNQSYPSIEIIIYDDASSDNSPDVIKTTISNNPSLKFVQGVKNLGNCRAFNQALSVANGKYVIDLAADDVLMTDRVELGVTDLEKAGSGFAVHYGNAVVIDEEGNMIEKEQFKNLPSGDIYKKLIERYFVNTASMMMSVDVLRKMGGYDASLSYEDFDFWIRSSRNYKYFFTPKILVGKRRVKNSLSSQQFKWKNKHQASTFKVIRKIKELNKTREEDRALKKRVLYEIRQCLRYGNLGLAIKYVSFYFSI